MTLTITLWLSNPGMPREANVKKMLNLNNIELIYKLESNR